MREHIPFNVKTDSARELSAVERDEYPSFNEKTYPVWRWKKGAGCFPARRLSFSVTWSWLYFPARLSLIFRLPPLLPSPPLILRFPTPPLWYYTFSLPPPSLISRLPPPSNWEDFLAIIIAEDVPFNQKTYSVPRWNNCRVSLAPFFSANNGLIATKWRLSRFYY